MPLFHLIAAGLLSTGVSDLAAFTILDVRSGAEKCGFSIDAEVYSKYMFDVGVTLADALEASERGLVKEGLAERRKGFLSDRRETCATLWGDYGPQAEGDHFYKRR